MTTIELETRLMFDLDYTRNLIVPCVTNANNLLSFESDLLILSKSNYATAIEIKVSKADLRNDLKKKHIKTLDIARMRDYYFKPIKYFYYAVPEWLQEEALIQIPSFAGLIIAKYVQGSEKYLKTFTVRIAKQISKYQWSDKERYDLARLGAMRIYNLKRNIINLSK